MSIEMRFAQNHETEDIRSLWEYCFEDPENFNDWFFKERYSPANTLVLSQESGICSALQLLPYNISIAAKTAKTSYLVGVSTWPRYRRKGFIKRLLIKSLEVMRLRREWVSILLPFNYDFYRKFGWETCYDHLIYEGSLLSSSNSKYHLSHKFRPIQVSADTSYLNSCYAYMTRKSSGYILRSEEDWKRLLIDTELEGGYNRIHVGDSGELGYILYKIDDNRSLHVREMGYNRNTSREAIMKFIFSHFKIADRVTIEDPFNTIDPILENKSDFTKCVHPFAMGRIVDVEGALQLIKPEDKIDLTITVEDEWLHWNNKRFRLKSWRDGLKVYKTNEKPDCYIPIGCLAQLLWGYKTPADIIESGQIVLYNNYALDMLNRLFHPSSPCLSEEF